MTDKTATQTMDETIAENRLHAIHRRFHDKWAPREGHYQSEFQADLAMLMREVHRDAIEPFTAAAAQVMAMRPLTPVYIKTARDKTEAD